MIVAVYDRDPYVHMLPIHKVYSDIQTVVAKGGDTSKVQIFLF